MAWKSVISIKHDVSSKSGLKRVILKEKDWDKNFGLVSKAITDKWKQQLGEDCYIMIGDVGVDSPKSLERAYSQLDSVARVNVIIKDGALKSRIEAMVIFHSKKIETSIDENTKFGELMSLIKESFGELKEAKIYQIEHEKDTDNLDVEIVNDDDLEGAIEVAKDDGNEKLYVLIKVL